MAINTGKVVVGGLIGGVVLNIIDFVSNGVIFANRMRADANAFKPGLGDGAAVMLPSQIVTYVISDFIIGLLIVFIYAAVRPRLGPGPDSYHGRVRVLDFRNDCRDGLQDDGSDVIRFVVAVHHRLACRTGFDCARRGQVLYRGISAGLRPANV